MSSEKFILTYLSDKVDEEVPLEQHLDWLIPIEFVFDIKAVSENPDYIVERVGVTLNKAHSNRSEKINTTFQVADAFFVGFMSKNLSTHSRNFILFSALQTEKEVTNNI